MGMTENEPAYRNSVVLRFGKSNDLIFRGVTDDDVASWNYEIANGNVFKIKYGDYSYTVNSKHVDYMEAKRYPMEAQRYPA